MGQRSRRFWGYAFDPQGGEQASSCEYTLASLPPFLLFCSLSPDRTFPHMGQLMSYVKQLFEEDSDIPIPCPETRSM